VLTAVSGNASEELRAWHAAGDYPRVALALGLRVIHISEIDTQTSTKYVYIESTGERLHQREYSGPNLLVHL
jgi:hypothetical protein